MIFFRTTDEDCLIQGTFKKKPQSGIPVFFNEQGVIEAVTNFLIYKALNSKDARSSVNTYAEQIQTFLRFFDARVNDFNWCDITDDHLTDFRDEYLDEQGKARTYVYNILRIIFEFLVWAERNKVVRGHVAIYNDDRNYSVSAKKSEKGNWVWPHMHSVSSKTQPTPTNDEIEVLHAKAFESSEITGFRDSLILTLFERSARRMEALQIKLSDIPDWDEIGEHKDNDMLIYIEVTGKGSKKRDLEFLPETIETIRDYIEGDRAKVVSAAKKRARKRGVSYQEPQEVLIDHVKGTELNEDYISRRISGLMKSARIKGTGHRVRAKGLTDIVGSYDGFDAKGQPLAAQDVLIRAAEKAGHSNITSLRPYLALSRSEGLAAKMNNIELIRNLEVRIHNKQKQLERLDKAEALFYAISNDVNVEEEILRFMENYIDYDTQSRI